MSEPTAAVNFEPTPDADHVAPPAPPPAPAPAPPPAAPPSRSFLGHAKLIGVLTLFSRVLGMAREVVAGHYLGTGVVASAFTVAFTIPNLFRKLFGEGALSAAFIPLYAQAVKRDAGAAVAMPATHRAEGDTSVAPTAPSAAAFAATSVNLLILILIAITIVGELVIGGLILLASDSNRPDRLLTLKLAAVMLPYVILICGTAFLGGILQVHKRFGPPAAAPILLNVCHIAVVFVGARILLLHHHDADPAETERRQTVLAYWLAFFVLVAGALQLMILLPALRAVGFRFLPSFNFRSEPVRRMLRLTVPVAIGAGVLQLSVLLDKGIALMLSRYEDAAGNAVTHFTLFGQSVAYPMAVGAAARLNLAQILYQFPLGVFAIALATAIFPTLSAEAVDADRERFRGVLRQGILATMFEGLPASLGLILVADPLVRLLFQHGQIEADHATLIVRSVIFYSLAVWAFSLQLILNRAYYALHDTKTPLVMSAVTLGVNLLVEIPLLWTPLAEAGMAAGTAVSFSIQAAVMLWILDRRVGGLGLGQLAKPVGKMLLATAVMGLALWLLIRSPLYPAGESRAGWLGQLALLTVPGAGVYLGACQVMGVDVLRHLRPKCRAAGRGAPGGATGGSEI